MALEKRELVVGQKVRGYGLLNEYGEFEFIPEQTGTRRGKVKQICQGENYTLSSSRDKIIVHVSYAKEKDKLRNLFKFASIFNELLEKIKKYEF